MRDEKPHAAGAQRAGDAEKDGAVGREHLLPDAPRRRQRASLERTLAPSARASRRRSTPARPRTARPAHEESATSASWRHSIEYTPSSVGGLRSTVVRQADCARPAKAGLKPDTTVQLERSAYPAEHRDAAIGRHPRGARRERERQRVADDGVEGELAAERIADVGAAERAVPRVAGIGEQRAMEDAREDRQGALTAIDADRAGTGSRGSAAAAHAHHLVVRDAANQADRVGPEAESSGLRTVPGRAEHAPYFIVPPRRRPRSAAARTP